MVLDRALEQQIAARVRRAVVLEGAEVEHLFAVTEVDGGEVAVAALAVERRLAAQPCVVAAERDRGGTERRVAPDVRALERDLPRVRAVLLYRHVPDVRAVADDQLHDCVDEVLGSRGVGVGGAEPVEHGDLGRLAGDDEGVREARESVALAPVQDDDRLVDDDARWDLHHRAAGEEGVVQHRERIG